MWKSKGLKRLLASLLLVVASALIATGNPVAIALALKLQALAAGLGVVGVVHAGVVNKKTLKKYLLATIASLVAVLQFIPGLSEYVKLLQQAAALLAAAAVGQKIGELQKKK